MARANNSYTVLISLVVALGGFVWGFDATVISGAVPFIKKYFQLTGEHGDFLLGLAVSCLGWGVLGGTAVAGYFTPIRPVAKRPFGPGFTSPTR